MLNLEDNVVICSLSVYNNAMILRLSYTIFLGLLLATFIGVGISAFYMSPKMPDQAILTQKMVPEPTASNEAVLVEQNREQQRIWDAYSKEQRVYDRNVSAIALAFSIGYLVIGLLFAGRMLILSDGLLLGSVFTLIYSIARGFNSQDETFRFIIVSVGLIIALVLGYMKFIKGTAQK